MVLDLSAPDIRAQRKFRDATPEELRDSAVKWRRLLMPEVIITHPKTGESYGIDSSDFRRGKHYRDPKSGDMKTYEAAGFDIVSLADGSEYTPPTPRQPAQDEHAP